jgi:hypothetical protein
MCITLVLTHQPRAWGHALISFVVFTCGLQEEAAIRRAGGVVLTHGDPIGRWRSLWGQGGRMVPLLGIDSLGGTTVLKDLKPESFRSCIILILFR